MIPKRILFCTDFSDNSLPARHLAVEYAQMFGADLLILHVINSSQLGYPSLDEGVPIDIRSALESIQESVDKALGLIATECREKLGSVDFASRIGNPPHEIVRFADENGVELIVMGTHGLTGIKHLIMGSTAENVVRSANCPVLTVRSPKS
ncbi:MAG: universal stress protein [Desulfomonilaceae bacterium]|nr:universal stress protein [Desulfomonilaceae bacterium]